MDIAEALQIVLDLAKGNTVDENEYDLADLYHQQWQAINMVEDLAVNEYGDD